MAVSETIKSKEENMIEIFFPMRHRDGEPFFYHQAVRFCRERGLTLTQSMKGFSMWRELQLYPTDSADCLRWHYKEGR